MKIDNSSDLLNLYIYLEPTFIKDNYHSRKYYYMMIKHAIRNFLLRDCFYNQSIIAKLEAVTFGGKEERTKIAHSYKEHESLLLRPDYVSYYTKLQSLNTANYQNDVIKFIIVLQSMSLHDATQELLKYFTPKRIFKEYDSIRQRNS